MTGLPSSSERLLCDRCHRPVEVSRDQHDVFEHMHHACFHCQFEHETADPDVECTAGGCPSAATAAHGSSRRTDRRPRLPLHALSRGQPILRRSLRASTSFVLALARCGRSRLTPAASRR